MSLLAPGAVVAGYRIESLVGRGGMGVVYRARELELDRQIALKVIAPELLEDPAIRDRFLKEARTAASIEHPNVIPVHAAGERDGLAYLAMRFIDGDDVRALVRRDGPLAPGRAANITAQAAAGLDAIHRAGYVHRDVKPANVLVDRHGHVYVTDFGLAKQMLSRSGATRTGQWVGTLDYVAPEQIRGGRIDARADVYALGGVLCFLLTGHVPFERESDEAKLWAQLSEPAPVPSSLRDGLPRELDGVVARAMAKTPGARYPSAGDLGRAARAAAAGGAPSQPERMVARGAAAPEGAATEPGLTPEASTLTATRPEAASAQTVRQPRRRRRPVIAAGLVAAVAAAVAVVVLVSGGAPDRPARDGQATKNAPRVRVVQTIRHVGRRPNGIAIAGDDLWVTSSDQPWVTRIDATTGREREQHPRVGLGASAIASDGTSVWVAAKKAEQVVRVDARSGRVVARLRPGAPPWRLAVDRGGLWVATTATPVPDQLIRYDAAGHEVERATMAHGVQALATGANALWVAERESPDVLRIDPRTHKSVVWAGLTDPASDLYYGAGYLWATLATADSIVRIDPRTGNTVTTAVGHRPESVVAVGGRLFVANTTDHTVLVIDPRTTRAEGPPLGVALNPLAITGDDRAVWVTGLGENTVTRIAYR